VQITDVRPITVSIPLRKPVEATGLRIDRREYLIVVVETDAGISGIGFTLTRGADLEQVVRHQLRPLLVGENPEDVQRLWDKQYYGSLYTGQRGLVMRAISTIDVALWDIKARALSVPLYRLLGGYRRQVPVLLVAGYYEDGKGPDQLAAEMKAYRDQGYTRLKLAAGGLDPTEDARRLAAVREAVGPDTKLMVDINHAWRNAKDAIHAAALWEPYNLEWIEEPFLPENMPARIQFQRAVKTKVALGDEQCSRFVFRDMITNQVADVLRPDTVVVGGITECLRVLALAATWELPASPHLFPEINVHLAAAFGNVYAVEMFPTDRDLYGFDRLLVSPLEPRDGELLVPEGPGLGFELNWDEVERYRIQLGG
jgi:D-arabinonate dehydratase